MKNRYGNLYKIIDEIKPRNILEIGTHAGVQAKKMCEQALKHSDIVGYTGFDLWEDLTPELKEYEHCGKRVATFKEANKNLKIHNVYSVFRSGNTLKTLPIFVDRVKRPFVDFAFIDGGHNIKTITSDWENVRKIMKVGGVVVFDDFYTWPPAEEGDYTIGCNMLIHDIIIYETHLVTFLDPLDSDPNSIHKIRMVRVDIQ